MTWRERIIQRRAAWERLIERDREAAIIQMRLAGHSFSAIADAVEYGEGTVRTILDRYGLAGPWRSDWRDKMPRAA